MNGVGGTFARCFGGEDWIGFGSFQTNGAVAPTAAMVSRPRYLPFSVSYAATGLYTVTFDPKTFKLPLPAYFVEAHLTGPIATVGSVRVVTNELHLTACRLQLQLVDVAGAALAPPANGSGVSVHFSFAGTNNTGR